MNASHRTQDIARLENFRAHAGAMRGDKPADWQWIGQWESQRHFGITEERAKGLQEQHGGEAKEMGGN